MLPHREEIIKNEKDASFLTASASTLKPKDEKSAFAADTKKMFTYSQESFFALSLGAISVRDSSNQKLRLRLEPHDSNNGYREKCNNSPTCFVSSAVPYISS